MQAITCRVCGYEYPSLLLIGEYAPFFQLRVDVQRDPFLQYFHIDRLSKAIGHLSRAKVFAEKVWRRGPKLLTSEPSRILRRVSTLVGGRVRMQDGQRRMLPSHKTLMLYCPKCRSVIPAHEFKFEDLSGLYHDYREPSYNRDRISVEPSYANIVDRVGSDEQEVSQRNRAVDAFLHKNAAHLKRGIMLDYGGSDGRFVPPCAREFFDGAEILEPSNAALHESVDTSFVRKVSTAENGKYSFVTNMHVAEHVGNPRGFVLEALQYVMPGGHLYLEAPVELTEAESTDFVNKKIDRTFTLHEHINKFSPGGMAKLVESTGVAKVIDDTVGFVDLGWTSGNNSRTLIQKL
jgi:hypothetical protein